MCGRFALSIQTDNVEKLLPELYGSRDIKPNYNIAPTQQIAVILDEKPNEINFVQWGLIPFWAKDSSIGSKMINARSESLLEKPSFKKLIHKKRCLIIASGFYEWKKGKDIESNQKDMQKAPYFIKMKTGELITFAGLWDKWINPDKEIIRTATIITTEPNELMKSIHTRMPSIILPEDREFWLSTESDINYITGLLKPISANLMEAFEVSRNVNNPIFNNESNMLPV